MIDFGKILFISVFLFPLTQLWFAFYKGENNYYDSDDYDGNGTAHLGGNPSFCLFGNTMKINTDCGYNIRKLYISDESRYHWTR